MIRNLWTIVVLLLVIIVSGWVAGTVGLAWLPHPWLVGLGLLILIAYAGGEVLRSLGLPALLGWIGTGVFLGPNFAALLPFDYPLTLIGEEMIQGLELIQVLIIAVIGMLGGAKFRVADLSGNIRLPLKLSGAFLLIVVPLTMGGVLLAGQLFPESLLFLSEQSAAMQWTIALFFGVLAFGLAPTVTVAMLQDLRSRGPLSTVVLGAVFLTEFVLFVLFAVVLSLGQAVAGPQEPTLALIAAEVPGVMWSLGLSVVVGAALAIVTSAYLRYIRREALLFVLVVLIAGFFGVAAAGAEPLLTFLVAGFLVQNLTDTGDVLNKALERIALPVFVVYFVIVAAGIELAGVMAYLPLVAILVATRIGGLYLGARWATASAVQSNHVYEYLRITFFPQAAVVLVLAGLVAEAFVWGPQFQSVVVSTVVIYLLVGSVFLKLGLDRSGETHRARRALIGEEGVLDATELKAERVRDLPEVMDLGEALAKPKFEDAWLRGHISDLREELIRRGRQVFYEPVRSQFRELHDELADVADVVDDQSEVLDEFVEMIRSGAEPEALVAKARTHQKKYSQQMIPVVRRIQNISGVAVGADDMQHFFDNLHQLEDQESLYRIERESLLDLASKDDGLALRALKATQRLRLRMMEQGYRTVPVGKLWRYHVELALPVRLGRRVPEVVVYNEKFWKRLWRHLRRLDVFWDSLIVEITGSYDEAKSKGEQSRGSDENPDHRRARLTRRRIDEFFAEFGKEQRELDTMAEQSARLSQYRFSQVIARCYERFLDAAGRAGTIYLPRFRYRASARFNQGRRAEHRVVDRLKRQETIVAGYRGWIRLDHELAAFEQWTHLFRSQLDESLEQSLGAQWRAGLAEFGELCRLCETLPEPESDDRGAGWEKFYRQKFRPQIAAFRQRQEELLARLHTGEATRSLTTEIDHRIAGLPETLAVLAGTPEDVVLPTTTDQYRLPLRQWIAIRVGREMALRIIEFTDRAAEHVEQRLGLLSSIEHVLEFNLVTVRKEDSELPDGQTPEAMGQEGLNRARRLISEFIDDAGEQRLELQKWLDDELKTITDKAIEPIEDRRLNEIQRYLAKTSGASLADRSENWFGGGLKPATEAVERLGRYLAEQGSKWTAEVRHLLVEEVDEFDQFESRHLLYAGEPVAHSEAPPIYRRLFVPTPLDIPEFYRPRKRKEQKLLDTIGEFFSGQDHALLISGASGVGKRTLIRQMIPARVYAVEGGLSEDQFATVRLSTVKRDESAISAALARALFGTRTAETFDGLSRRIHRRKRGRNIVVVENAERVVLRTEDGLKLTRKFLDMIEKTADRVLWIVVMGSAAADYLTTHLDLESYFTQHEHVQEFKAEQLEAMIMSRHQAGGFDIHFQSPELSPLERLSQPFFGAESRNLARKMFFERLTERSMGNPRAALLHWLRAVSIDPVDHGRIRVRPLEKQKISLLAPLGLKQRMLLAIFTMHSSLAPEEVAAILEAPIEDVERNIRYLTRLGFLELVPDTSNDHRIRSIATVWVEHELRQINLI